MRMLNKNKTKIWYSNSIVETDEKDENGFFTGYTINVYTDLKECSIHLYPTNGLIREELFGKDCNFDAIACSDYEIFNENTIIFLTKPISDIKKENADYYVSRINKSLNTIQYGLVRCVK